MASIKTIEIKAKDYYFNQWRGHEKIIPAFNEIVYVTKLGWNHIAHHPRRKLLDKIMRLKKLENWQGRFWKGPTHTKLLKSEEKYIITVFKR